MRLGAGVQECLCTTVKGLIVWFGVELPSISSATFRNLWLAVSKHQATMFGIVKGRKNVTTMKCL